MAKINKIKKFLSCFACGKAQDTSFLKLLDKTDEAGVNDFSVPFHRDPFDYCDGYYVIIKVDGKYNLVYYDWSQYSGYHYTLCSTEWFDHIYTDESRLLGHIHKFRHNHIEVDYNAGRGWCGSLPSLLKVMLNGQYSFIRLRDKYENNLITDKWFGSVTEWSNGEGAYTKSCIVTIDGKEYKFNSEGVLIDKTKNLNVELNVAKEVFKTKDKIINDWILKGRPCAFRYGFAYKGAGCRLLTKEESLAKIKTHSFGMGFYEMYFEIIQSIGDVALVFNEFSESDMW